jgi:hypothetical protein
MKTKFLLLSAVVSLFALAVLAPRVFAVSTINLPSNTSPTVQLNGSGNSYFNAGNVGIGTTNPNGKLQVTGGNILISDTGSNDALLDIQRPDRGSEAWFGLPGWASSTFYLFGPTASGNEAAFSYGNATWSFFTGGSIRMTINSSGNVGIGTTSPGYTLDVNGTGHFSGKLTANTIDPLYTINGTNYATYVPGMTGENEETAGTVDLQKNADGTYSTTMDFATAAKGSSLWLFAQATNLANTMSQMIVTLTPSFDGNVWYTKSVAADTLTIHGAAAGEVSYNLTAPRFDAAQWPNLAPANESSTTGLIINNQ